jgi:DNA-directed RNA polymerase subunit RPC12/RpoP
MSRDIFKAYEVKLYGCEYTCVRCGDNATVYTNLRDDDHLQMRDGILRGGTPCVKGWLRVNGDGVCPDLCARCGAELLRPVEIR